MPDRLFAGRYRLGELLGRGGMSEVWSATDVELGRRVALKLLAPHADTARFEREARAVASLTHPNVTQLYDYGSAGGRPFMVLEYLPGGTLEDRLRSGRPLPDAATARIAAEMAAGLAHAHARGVVHRDLKPANVLFDEEGRAKLADFGIARLASGGGTLTEAGTLLGTAAYISPEQAAGAPAGAAGDVYSFGVILYRLLTGRLPFESDDPMQLVALHRDAAPPPPSRFRGDMPPLLESTASAALRKDPRERPPDGRALLAALGVGGAAAEQTAATTVLPPPGATPADAATRVLPLPAAGGGAGGGRAGRRRPRVRPDAPLGRRHADDDRSVVHAADDATLDAGAHHRSGDDGTRDERRADDVAADHDTGAAAHHDPSAPDRHHHHPDRDDADDAHHHDARDHDHDPGAVSYGTGCGGWAGGVVGGDVAVVAGFVG